MLAPVLAVLTLLAPAASAADAIAARALGRVDDIQIASAGGGSPLLAAEREVIARDTRSSGSANQSPSARDTRQHPPSSGSSGAKHGHHGHSTRAYHYGSYRHGSYRYGYGYPYSPYRWWWGFWGPAYHYPYYYPFYYPYHYPFYSPVYRATYSVSASGGAIGALDLNIKPKKAGVYVDGYYIGKAKRYDGYPGYLWLEKGTYEVTFYLAGHQTLTQNLTIRPGAVIDVRFELAPGEATLPPEPKEIAESSPGQQDGGRDYRGPDATERLAEPAAPENESWRDGSDEPRDLRGDPGRLHLVVQPEDASIYLDGRFLGSARELAGLHGGLLVDPGEHTLEVVRPGFSPRQVNFEVDEGEDLDLVVELNLPGQRNG